MIRATLACALVLAAGAVGALTTDRKQPIEIEADRMEVDDARRVTIYRGDVVIVQGSLRITGDTVWIHYDERSELTKMVSVGRQAHFRQLPDEEPDFRMAYADRLEYYKDRDLIVMLGNASYRQGQDKITANRIVYDSRHARMKADAGSPASASAPAGTPEGTRPGRIKIKIVPKKKCEQENSDSKDCDGG